MLHARVRDGSLRAAATESGATMLLFEGGEAWRFDSDAIDVGVQGIRNVMAELAMIDPDTSEPRDPPIESRRSTWVRARRSGLALLQTELGMSVERGQLLGVIHDSVGRRLSRITAPRAGIVIGHIQHPLVNQGDAVVHIADVRDDSDTGASAAWPQPADDGMDEEE
jgi:predicted deacylase